LDYFLSRFKIGLAVGEVQALLLSAKSAQLDMIYELVRDYEILRVQFHHRICKCCCLGMIFETQAYETMDIVNLPWYTQFGRWISKLLTRELFDSELADEPIEDESEKNMSILVQIQNEIRKVHKQQKETDEVKKIEKDEVKPVRLPKKVVTLKPGPRS